jgi:hypothetical protein
MNKTVLRLSWALIGIGTIISIYFTLSAYCEGFTISGDAKIDFLTTGQFGDFLGGVVGTFFALAGTLLIYLTFKEQTSQNVKEGFENTFFELVSIHRDNVNQLSYTKFDNGELREAETRKVFRLIFSEFLECYREVRKFSNSKNPDDYILHKYKIKLQKVIDTNNLKVNIIELALIDIAYSIIFFGVGEEGEIILRDKFKRKYNHEFFYHLLRYMKLKPKRENRARWDKWKKLLSYDYKKFKSVSFEFYHYRPHLSDQSLSNEVKDLIFKDDFNKYYGGHQHRLGHYFRHLFQSFKFVNYNEHLTEQEKYFYAKTLRAQLSTYEQAILFINSISTFGMKWEYLPEKHLLKNKEDIKNCQLITRYNLIKNLPGYHMFGIRYKSYYPNIKYEAEEL